MLTLQRLFFLGIILILSACGSSTGSNTSAVTSANSQLGNSSSVIAQKLTGKWKLYNTYCGYTKTDDGTRALYLEFSNNQLLQYGLGCVGVTYSALYLDTTSTSGADYGTVTLTSTTTSSSCQSPTHSTMDDTVKYTVDVYKNDSTIQLTGNLCDGYNRYITTYTKQ